MMMNSATDTNKTTWTIVFSCWLVACIAVLGSLFFSEVMEFSLCLLCWYQRIFWFPLVFIFTAALFPLDEKVSRYALPLALAGWLTAGYHNLLVWGIVPESISPCSQGVSCTENYMELYGFVTIPLLSWLGFTTIVGMLVALKQKTSK